MDVVPPPGVRPWPDDHVLTDFQRGVVRLVVALRPGELTTYGEIAAELGRPGAAQAVANVVRGVPDLPWWRIVPSDGRLYRTHAPAQRDLLEREGHVIDAERRVLQADGREPSRSHP